MMMERLFWKDKKMRILFFNDENEQIGGVNLIKEGECILRRNDSNLPNVKIVLINNELKMEDLN